MRGVLDKNNLELTLAEYNAGYKAGQKAKARDQKRKEKNAKPIKWT